ncbi:MAG: phosphodiester glycosidase family protein [Clostridia bacterium]|jgi:exopolysaccharide biosynthesis protein|nr:phosphodiester glycosidase family protein [Clostridia bacterium]
MKKLLLILALCIMTQDIQAYTEFSSIEDKIELRDGIEYTKKELYTKEGFIDFHIIKIDKHGKYEIENIVSKDIAGAKKRLTDLANENDSILAINAEFFNTKANPTNMLGANIENGSLKYGTTGLNVGQNKFGAVAIRNGSYNLEYPTFSLSLIKNENEKIVLSAYNQFEAFGGLVYGTYEYIKDTKMLDEKHKNIHKILIEDGKVKSKHGIAENVILKEGQSIILFNNPAKDIYNLGDKVKLHVDTNINLVEIRKMFMGASKIIENGNVKTDGLIITGRHPRSLLGYNENSIYLIAVDGRRKSIGIRHSELGEFLKEENIFNAIALDGGGSSTLVHRNGFGEYDVLNTLSGTSERSIPSAIAITTKNKEIGTVRELDIVVPKENILIGEKIKIDILAKDKNGNSVAMEKEEIKISTSGMEVKKDGLYLTPMKSGKLKIKVSYKGRKEEKIVLISDDIVKIETEDKLVHLGFFEEDDFIVYAYNSNGEKAIIDTDVLDISIERKVGEVKDNLIKSNDELTQTIGSIRYKDAMTHFVFRTGYKEKEIDSFEREEDINFEIYKVGTEGKARYSNTSYKGRKAIKLDYSFENNGNRTQAAYVDFVKPIDIEGEPRSLSLRIKGDNSGNIIRGKYLDAEGNLGIITFTKNVDFSSYKRISGMIDEGTKYPIKFKKIYVISNSVDDHMEGRLYFDDLRAEYKYDFESINAPEDKEKADELNKLIDTDDKYVVLGNEREKKTYLDYLVSKKQNKDKEEFKDIKEENDAFKYIELIFSTNKLSDMEDDKVIELFNMLDNEELKNIIINSNISIDDISYNEKEFILKKIKSIDKNVFWIKKEAEESYVNRYGKLRNMGIKKVIEKNDDFNYILFTIDDDKNLNYYYEKLSK